MKVELNKFNEAIGVGAAFMFIALWKSIELDMLIGFPLCLLIGFLVAQFFKIRNKDRYDKNY
ncbi:MAG TPA: hypothetical protein EYF97_02180 [Gammaproteobacteria bacterium]|nr:hypothetical protein [Gammaproteobacteria bacterium]HIK72063.1 hypothetical protein [Gammaproteobacteria bacterium]